MQAADDRAKRLEETIESLRSELHTAQLNAATQSRQTKELEALLGEERQAHEQVRACICVRECVCVCVCVCVRVQVEGVDLAACMYIQ